MIVTGVALGPRTGYDGLAPLRLPEISITGTTTLTTANLGRQHVCSGTSANYTVNLPAAAQWAGQYLTLRMAQQALTKFVTLDPNGSETLDGATTEVFWAGEAITLYSDGSNLVSTERVRRKMLAVMRLATSVTTNTGAVYFYPTDNSGTWAAVSDLAGLIDTSLGKITWPRAADLLCIATGITNSNVSDGQYANVAIELNGTTQIKSAGLTAPASTQLNMTTAVMYQVAAGDYLRYQARTSEANKGLLGDSSNLYSALMILEN